MTYEKIKLICNVNLTSIPIPELIVSLENIKLDPNGNMYELEYSSNYGIILEYTNISGLITNIQIKNSSIVIEYNMIFGAKETITLKVQNKDTIITKNVMLELNASFYGVKMQYDSSDKLSISRVESEEGLHSSLPVHESMKYCVINFYTSEKRYLDKNDFSKFEDGSDFVDHSLYNWFVELPEFYVYCDENYVLISKNIFTVELLNTMFSDHVFSNLIIKTPVRYVGMYEAYNTSNVLRSIPGYTPSTSTSGSTFLARARANDTSTNDYNTLTSQIQNTIQILYMIEYCSVNSLDAFNSELTVEGYHQGGLGTGLTNTSLTTNTAIPNYITIGANNGLISYRGIVNPFGNCYKELVDTISGNYSGGYKSMQYTNKKSSFSRGTIPGDWESRPKYYPTSSGWINKVHYETTQEMIFFTIDLVISSEGGCNFKDCLYSAASVSTYGLFIGGVAVGGSGAGLWFVRGVSAVGVSSSAVGCRLTYLPNDPE